MKEELAKIQTLVSEQGVDAYVMLDYENRNPNMVKILGQRMLTRKIIMVVPATGRPYIITHLIDTVNLRDEETLSCFDLLVYKTWQEMLEIEKEHFTTYKTVAMDVSENGLLPRVSLADWGSVEYVSSLGCKIVSSGNILQSLSAKVGKKGLQSQQKACRTALKIMKEAFALIGEEIKKNSEIQEVEVQSFITRRFIEEGMVYDEPPIVAIGPNASNPHYAPSESESSPIHEGDLVLIDMWAKYKGGGEVYADITWMGYVGREVPQVYIDRFSIVKAARDGVIAFLKENLPHRKVSAYEADDVARKIITDAGYGEYFIHRVGHNIADDVSPHGPGANLDNYESHDDRELLSGTSFSDEPGIYAPDFGVRSETDLFNDDGELVVTGGLQDEIIAILA